MDISIRRARASDFDEVVRLDAASFGMTYTDGDVDEIRRTVDLDRFWLAVEGERIVGISGEYALQMTPPGRSPTAVPGVTWVSVAPTHRRRGILSALMRHQLLDYAERSEPLTILTASEGGIYRRFGFGAATQVRRIELDRRRAQLASPVSVESVVLATDAEARTRVPEIHRRWCAATPGAIARSEAKWELIFEDRPERRRGMSARSFLVHPEGYVGYRIGDGGQDGLPHNRCSITDYAVVSERAHRELWQVLLGLDLVGTIETTELPMDDPLPWLLNDPRLARTTAVTDGMWVRPLDVAAVLAGRGYAADVEVVIEVIDPLLGDGRYELRAGPDGAECRRVDRAADLCMPVHALGSSYLGGHRLAHLARAGFVESADDRALRRLDSALLTQRSPQHGTVF